MTRSFLVAISVLSLFVIEAVAGHQPSTRGHDLAEAALKRTSARVTYDGSYRTIAYPMGDVAPDRGVCTDVIIRSYRALGVDLQQLIHEDMSRAFSAYPNHWGLTTTDRNIDHRRVPNIRRFLERQGAEVVVLQDPKAYQPGDIVTWSLGNFMPHIGIVSGQRAPSGNPMIVHNIGAGPKLEDMLFDYEITGHYRYLPG